MKRRRSLEKQMDRIETRRDPRAYIFYGVLTLMVLMVIAIAMTAAVRGGR